VTGRWRADVVVDPLPDLDRIVEVYRAACREPPYLEDETSVERFATSFTRDAGADGFRCVVVEHGDQVVGFGYGYSGGPGSWWYDHVADALDPRARERWLVDYLELVELAVLPGRHGEGIGGAAHDALLGAASQRTAALTVVPGTVAGSMYRRRGWQPIARGAIFDSDTHHIVMGIDLPRRRA